MNIYPTNTIAAPQIHLIEDRPLRVKAGEQRTRCGRQVRGDWDYTDKEATCQRCLTNGGGGGWHGTLRNRVVREGDR